MNSFLVRAENSNNRFSPQLKTDEHWEVALCDMALHNIKSTRPSLNEKL